MLKTNISSILRNSGLIFFFDKLYFKYQQLKNRRKNNAFKKENPEFLLPPDYILYESYQMDHAKYYQDGLNTAQWIIDHISRFKELKNIKILDWGCGPARILRHLPALLDGTCQILGTDYNKTTISWCRDHLKNIDFSVNDLQPPLPYPDEEFDAVYGISIFTHLSGEMHYAWINELSRILKSGGIIFITTQGEIFRSKLSEKETELFDKGSLVIRGRTKEGHRTYSAFQPDSLMTKLLSGFDILDHIRGELRNDKMLQDVWIAKKK